MNKIFVTIFALLFIPALAFSQQDFHSEWVDLSYARYRVSISSEDLLLIDTQAELTLEKASVINSMQTTNLLTDPAKDLYGRLMKIPDVKLVVITARRIEILKFPFKTMWEDSLDQILSALEATIATEDSNRPNGK